MTIALLKGYSCETCIFRDSCEIRGEYQICPKYRYGTKIDLDVTFYSLQQQEIFERRNK